ncbi:MAG: hypothetical protein WDW38_003327 [Sanguina aurantia]
MPTNTTLMSFTGAQCALNMTAVRSAALHASDRTAVKTNVMAAAAAAAATAGSFQQPPVAVSVRPGRRAAAPPANLRNQYLNSLSVELDTTASGRTGLQEGDHRREQEVLLLSQLYSMASATSCTDPVSGPSLTGPIHWVPCHARTAGHRVTPRSAKRRRSSSSSLSITNFWTAAASGASVTTIHAGLQAVSNPKAWRPACGSGTGDRALRDSAQPQPASAAHSNRVQSLTHNTSSHDTAKPAIPNASALLRQQLQQQSGSHTPTRSYDSYASTHNSLEPSGVFNSSSYELPGGRQTAANNSGGMPDASNYGLGSWHASQAPAGSPMMCTPPRSPHIMGYTSPRGTGQQQHYHDRPNSMGSSHSGGSGMGGGPAVYDMKSLTSAISMVPSGTGDIRRIFQSATFGPRLPGLTKLVSQLTREGHWSKGLEVFDSLDVIGLRPDTTITNAAISACDKGGQWEKGMQIFTHMAEWGLSRDAITYSAAISALSKGRQWSLAIDVFNHMCDCGVDCDAVTCCSLITALDKGGQWQLAEQVFMQMYAEHPQFKVLLQCMGEEPGAGSTAAAPTTVAQLMSSDPGGRGGMNLAVGGNTDPLGAPSRPTQSAIAAAAAYAASAAAAADLSSSGSGSPWYGPPASPAGTSPTGPLPPLDAAQLKGLSLVGGDEVIEKVKGQWLPAHGSGTATQLSGSGSGSGIVSQPSGFGSGTGNAPAGTEAWGSASGEGGVGGVKAREGEGQLQALQRLQQQLHLADAAAASVAATSGAGGSVHGGGVLPLIRSPSMSGPNAGRDPAEVLMAQASMAGMLSPGGGSRSMWPASGSDLPASFLMDSQQQQQHQQQQQQQQQMGGGGMAGGGGPSAWLHGSREHEHLLILCSAR